MIMIFETSDLGRFEVAKSILRANDIEFIVSGEGLQDLIGVGRIGGTNLVTGPAQLAVSDDNAENARELLADLMDDK